MLGNRVGARLAVMITCPRKTSSTFRPAAADEAGRAIRTRRARRGRPAFIVNPPRVSSSGLPSFGGGASFLCYAETPFRFNGRVHGHRRARARLLGWLAPSGAAPCRARRRSASFTVWPAANAAPARWRLSCRQQGNSAPGRPTRGQRRRRGREQRQPVHVLRAAQPAGHAARPGRPGGRERRIRALRAARARARRVSQSRRRHLRAGSQAVAQRGGRDRRRRGEGGGPRRRGGFQRLSTVDDDEPPPASPDGGGAAAGPAGDRASQPRAVHVDLSQDDFYAGPSTVTLQQQKAVDARRGPDLGARPRRRSRLRHLGAPPPGPAGRGAQPDPGGLPDPGRRGRRAALAGPLLGGGGRAAALPELRRAGGLRPRHALRALPAGGAGADALGGRRWSVASRRSSAADPSRRACSPGWPSCARRDHAAASLYAASLLEIGDRRYLAPRLGVWFSQTWPHADPPAMVWPEYFQILDIPPDHVYYADQYYRLCLFATWREQPAVQVLQNRVVPRLLIDLMVADLQALGRLDEALDSLDMSLYELYNVVGRPEQAEPLALEVYERLVAALTLMILISRSAARTIFAEIQRWVELGLEQTSSAYEALVYPLSALFPAGELLSPLELAGAEHLRAVLVDDVAIPPGRDQVLLAGQLPLRRGRPGRGQPAFNREHRPPARRRAAPGCALQAAQPSFSRGRLSLQRRPAARRDLRRGGWPGAAARACGTAILHVVYPDARAQPLGAALELDGRGRAVRAGRRRPPSAGACVPGPRSATGACATSATPSVVPTAIRWCARREGHPTGSRRPAVAGATPRRRLCARPATR